MKDTQRRAQITAAINDFNRLPLFDAAISLFDALGYDTSLRQRLDKGTYSEFKELFIENNFGVQSRQAVFSEERARTADWAKTELLFQLTDESVQNAISKGKNTAEGGQIACAPQAASLKGKAAGEGASGGKKVDTQIIKSYLFFAVDLLGGQYSRSSLAAITREVNKIFPMPVMMLFRYGEEGERQITIAANNRRVDRRDAGRDVMLKVSLIKDIRTSNPHRSHIDILCDLCMNALQAAYRFEDFAGLHNAWIAALDTRLLNKKFYGELVSWFFWALTKARFPNCLDSKGERAEGAAAKTDEAHNTESLIRFISRILFVWFIKEKSFVNEKFFSADWARSNLAGFDAEGEGTVYYKAVLQNLFFAALNCPVEKRGFRKSGTRYSPDMGVDILMRYRSLFASNAAADEFLQAVNESTPFMNGGLFECMDRTEKKGAHTKKIYIDGFSDREDSTLSFPDVLLFGGGREADLFAFYDEGGKQKGGEGSAHRADLVRGLIPLLQQYKFTVTENTPLEEDVALDPELLGRVFENLLASVNSETKQTARKDTGSFYTPREVVGYMADEVLKAVLKKDASSPPLPPEMPLDALFASDDKTLDMSRDDRRALVQKIASLKVLDPACGSGAFPMGVLLRLVGLLQKLDRDNTLWQEAQLERVKAVLDPVRDKEGWEKAKAVIDEIFNQSRADADYARKLYLIENCIYGVDIQTIAVQITKLRFFISLAIDQQKDAGKENFGIRALPNLEMRFIAANTFCR